MCKLLLCIYNLFFPMVCRRAKLFWMLLVGWWIWFIHTFGWLKSYPMVFLDLTSSLMNTFNFHLWMTQVLCNVTLYYASYSSPIDWMISIYLYKLQSNGNGGNVVHGQTSYYKLQLIIAITIRLSITLSQLSILYTFRQSCNIFTGSWRWMTCASLLQMQ